MQTPTDPTMFAEHRSRFLDALGDDAALLFAPPEKLRNGDAEYRYRQSSDVLWLTGWTEPACAILFRPGAEQPFIMFVQAKDPEREVWTGRRQGTQGAEENFGADAAFPFKSLSEKLPDLLQGYENLHYQVAEDADRDVLVVKALKSARRKARRNGLAVPSAFVDPERVLHELRLFKSDAELDLLREAASITNDAMRRAMAVTAPDVNEYELEAEIAHAFRRKGGTPGYTTIVGGGDNATVLHYVTNNDPLQAGDLVCVDAGCEHRGYTADVTRTWPVNGRFTDAQREIYDAVLEAQLAAIATAVPGATFMEVTDVAARSLTASMLRLGLLEGDPDDDELVDTLIDEEKHKRFYMHGIGHWLGLDVHDVGAYTADGKSRRLAPGMVLTIEPGLYINPDDETVPEALRGVGIRIEDDVLITKDGNEVLTAMIPKGIEEVEACIGHAAQSAAAR
jgi:Xaa-Pro aminopeptidase